MSDFWLRSGNPDAYVSSVRSANERKQIAEQLQNSIRNLLAIALTEQDGPIVIDQNIAAYLSFERSLENLLKHGLKLRVEKLKLYTVTLWDFIQTFKDTHFREDVKDLIHVKSNIGRARATLRLALNENNLEGFIEQFISSEMLSLFYSEGAFLLSYEDTAFLQSSLYSLLPIQFHLEINDKQLDLTTNQNSDDNLVKKKKKKAKKKLVTIEDANETASVGSSGTDTPNSYSSATSSPVSRHVPDSLILSTNVSSSNIIEEIDANIIQHKINEEEEEEDQQQQQQQQQQQLIEKEEIVEDNNINSDNNNKFIEENSIITNTEENITILDSVNPIEEVFVEENSVLKEQEEEKEGILKLSIDNKTEPELISETDSKSFIKVESSESNEELIQLEEQLRKMSAERILLLEQRNTLINNTTPAPPETNDVAMFTPIYNEEDSVVSTIEEEKLIKHVDNNVLENSTAVIVDSNKDIDNSLVIDVPSLDIHGGTEDTNFEVVSTEKEEEDIILKSEKEEKQEMSRVDNESQLILNDVSEENQQEEYNKVPSIEEEEAEEFLSSLDSDKTESSEEFSLANNRYYLKFINSKPSSNSTPVLIYKQELNSVFTSVTTTNVTTAPSSEYKESKLDINTDISTKQTPQDQYNKCFGCKKELSNSIFSQPRYCEYYGKYFCKQCHMNQKSLIPARIIHNWDFYQYPVSIAANHLLQQNFKSPIFDIQILNPLLFKNAPLLKNIQVLRTRLYFMQDFIFTCKEKQYLLKHLNNKLHFIKHINLYSLEDLQDAAQDKLRLFLLNVTEVFLKHIMNCSICKQKSLVCKICNEGPIYPFNIVKIVSCKSCTKFYHRTCFQKIGCINCNK